MLSSPNHLRQQFQLLSIITVLWLAAAAGLQARTFYLAPGGNDRSPCRAGAEFATLARAVECLAPGDTLFIRNGSYAGGVEIRVKASAERPVVVRGESLEAVIEGSADKPDAVRVEEASHIVLENFTARAASRAGAAVRHSHDVKIIGCRFEDNGTWGIFTSFADDIHFENNETCGSVRQHGIYHSNSGDRFVIRGNRVHDNSGNGIHLNGDPEIPGGDGVLNEGVVERNIIWGNGKSGGAGINMTHVHDVVVRNNILFNNLAGGITVYQDTGTFEQGSKRVVIIGNTVVFLGNLGRSGVNVQTTSEKVVVAGNIFISGGKRGNLEVNSDHLETVYSDFNLLWG
ncbi:MAG TPA: right-handed parallel beta-helix repeat-containing protein, partial [Candidatus Glassbacteria bacterium]|nr:right-handed parallel beta-helix repeat-containing protein [Candidatus Glassbacteria bacterium]